MRKALSLVMANNQFMTSQSILIAHIFLMCTFHIAVMQSIDYCEKLGLGTRTIVAKVYQSLGNMVTMGAVTIVTMRCST